VLGPAVAEAVTAGGSPDLVGWLIAQGPVGVLALVIGYGWKRERDRADSEQRRGDAERAAKDALARELIDKVVPALGDSTGAIREFLRYARGVGRED
jgi:hypothetical protein